MDERYLAAIRGFEGFTPKANWDYRQHSNGYGTRAAHAGEVIDEAEAQRRFASEIAEARAIVERAAPNVDEGTKAALTSLTYNAGAAWTKAGLGDAVRAGDMDAARKLFLQYDNAGGEKLPGLSKRRSAEAEWFGGAQAGPGDAGQTAPPLPHAAGTGQGEDMDIMALLGGLFSGGGAGGGGGVSLPGGVKLKGNKDLLNSTMAGLGQGAQQGAMAPMQRQPVDLQKLSAILSNRSRLGM